MNWKASAGIDSNFATNMELHKVLLVGGCYCSVTSKLQSVVTLSSTKAEYYAASTCADDIEFLQMLF